MINITKVIIALSFYLISQVSIGQEPVVQEPVAQEPVVQEPVVQEPVAQEPVAQEPPPVVTGGSDGGIAGQFGFGFGIGINRLSKAHIVDAAVINNKINIREKENDRYQLWLEAHYPLGGKYIRKKCIGGPCKVTVAGEEDRELTDQSIFYTYRKFYQGPFFAVQVSDGDNLLNGAALGWMFSYRRGEGEPTTDDKYFNVGIGFTSTKITTLGGKSEGDAIDVSAGETLNLKKETDHGIMILFSINSF